MTTRLDTAIDEDLGGHVPVSDATVADFERDGFVRLAGVLRGETIRALEPGLTAAVLARNTNVAPMHERTTYQRAFIQVTHLWRDCEEARRFAFSRKLARLAADLLRVDSVRLFHEQALYKEPSGGFTPWHADQYYWPLDTDRAVTVWIPLQDTPLEMGPLEFAPGSHRLELGRGLEISDESEAAVAAELAAADLGVDRAPYAVGDVSFHQGWTFHRAEPNQGGEPRRVMTVVYVDAAARFVEPSNHQQRRTIESLPGTRPGAVVESDKNPVLYP